MSFLGAEPARRPVTADDLDDTVVASVLDRAHPVGCIMMTTSAVNPGTAMGFGTWTQIAHGRTIVGEGAGSGLTARTAGTTGGGEDSIVPTHTHDMSNHTHSGTSATVSANHAHQWTRYGTLGDGGTGVPYDRGGDGAIVSSATSVTGGFTANHTHTFTSGGPSSNTSGSSGESATDKNMMPYLVTYIWERTA